MRSEHKATGDEWDLMARRYWRVLTRAGTSKAIKVISHRMDRHTAKRKAINEGVQDFFDKDVECPLYYR